jgi:DNA-binding transcriptional MerR regulator
MSVHIDTVATSLGLSVRGVRHRIDMLGDILSPHLRKGPNGRLVFNGDAVATLKHLEELRKTHGVSVTSAVGMMRQREEESEEPVYTEATREACGELTASPMVTLLLAAKDETIHELRSRVAFLEERIERLEPLALPKPRQWRTLFRR